MRHRICENERERDRDREEKSNNIDIMDGIMGFRNLRRTLPGELRLRRWNFFKTAGLSLALLHGSLTPTWTSRYPPRRLPRRPPGSLLPRCLPAPTCLPSSRDRDPGFPGLVVVGAAGRVVRLCQARLFRMVQGPLLLRTRFPTSFPGYHGRSAAWVRWFRSLVSLSCFPQT